MANRIISIELTGTNTKAVKAIEGTSASAAKAGTEMDSKLGGAATRVGSKFSALDSSLGRFGGPFAGALTKVGTGLDKAEKQSSSFGKKLSTIGGVEAAAGLGVFVAGLSSVIAEGRESIKVGHLTDAAIKSTGGAANVTAAQVGSLANSLSEKIGIDDEAIQSNENLLLTFTNVRNEAGKGNDVFNQATVAIQDMSVAIGQDARSSTIQLGKALNDPIKGLTSLRRVGVAFTAQQQDQIKTLVNSGKTLEAQKIILGELGKEFGGAAAAAADPLSKLDVKIKNVEESIGKGLLPQIQRTIDGVDTGVGKFQDFNASLDGVPGKVLAVGAALPVAAFAFDKVESAGSAVVSMFGKVGSGIGSVARGVGSLVTSSGEAAAASTEEATALQLSVAAASDKTVALAGLGIAEEKAATATATRVAAESALAAANYDTLASDAEIVAASRAVSQAQATEAGTTAKLAAAREAAAVAGGESAGAGAVEATGASFAAALGPITLVAAAITGAGLVLNHYFGTDNSTGQIKKLSADLLDVGNSAEVAKAGLTNIIGSNATALVSEYGDELLRNASKSELATTKTHALDAAVLDNGGNFLKAKDQVGAATDALDKLLKTQGQTAVQTAVLSAAEKQYSDDSIAAQRGDSVAAARLATDKTAVVNASQAQASTEKTVTDAVNEGVAASKKSQTQSAKTADQLKAEDTARKNLVKSLDKLGAVAGPDAQKVADAEGKSRDQVDKLTESVKTMNSAFDSSFDGAISVLDKFKDKSQVSFQQFASDQLKSIAATTNWATNIAQLAKDGINQGFLDTLIKAGPTQAGLVQSILDNVGKGSIGTVNALSGAADSAKTKTQQTLDDIRTGVTAFNQFIDGTKPHLDILVTANGKQIGSDAAGNAVSGNGLSVGGSKVRAAGGPVQKGDDYIVTEQGPEVFQVSAPANGLKRGDSFLLDSHGPTHFKAPADGAIIPNHKIKFAAEGAGVPFGTFGTNSPVSVQFNSGNATSTTGSTGTGTANLDGASQQISDFNQKFIDDQKTVETRTKQVTGAIAKYQHAVENLGAAQHKVQADTQKFNQDAAASHRVDADLSAVSNAQAKLNADKKAGRDTTADQKALDDAHRQLYADQSAAHRLSADLLKIQADTEKERHAETAKNLAATAVVGSKHNLAVAKTQLQNAGDPATFTASVEKTTSALKLFESELKVLVHAGDKNLARALYNAGPDQGQPLAAGFASNLAEARKAEQALTGKSAQDADFVKFGGSFDKGGIVPGPLGKAIPIIAHGGEFIDNTPLRGGRPGGGGIINLHINATVEPLTGRVLYKVVRDDQAKNGPWKIQIAG